MRITINNNNEITGYAIVGGIDGDFEISDDVIPDTFIDEFKNGKFLYIDGKIKYNRDYLEPAKEIERPNNNEAMQQEVNDLKQQVADLTALIQQLLNKE
jgi:hypothetical protein